MTNEQRSTPVHNHSVSVKQFVLGVAVMIALNISRLALTWGAQRFDGMEQLGFPFVFFERGGFGGIRVWHLDMLAVDIALAIAVPWGIAVACPDGVLAFLRRFPRWGLDHVYGSESDESKTR